MMASSIAYFFFGTATAAILEHWRWGAAYHDWRWWTIGAAALIVGNVVRWEARRGR